MKHDDEQPQPAQQPTGTDPAGTDPAGEQPSPGALLEPPEEAVARLESQLAELKDRHLRLAAEYDNFRKRTQKERTDLWAKAQADLLHRLVDALDDLARCAHVDAGQADAATVDGGGGL